MKTFLLLAILGQPFQLTGRTAHEHAHALRMCRPHGGLRRYNDEWVKCRDGTQFHVRSKA